MKGAYPIVLYRCDDDSFYVEIPDFDSATQGKDMVDAIEMARDAIGLLGIELEDEKKEIPLANTVKGELGEGAIMTYVDVDFSVYRKKVDNRAVKKNCTIPYWVSVEADKANVNYSRVLQDALVNLLGLKYNNLN